VRPRAEALVLAAAVFAVWLPALGASFQFDDWSVIVGDPRVQTIAAWWDSMPGMRALTKLSYAANHEFGDGPAGFRAVNVALHAVNAVLVYTLLRALAVVLAPARRASLLAITGALVFALHPVQTESVTYVAGRSNVLMATFALAASYAWVRRCDGRSRAAWSFAVLAATACALCAKETAAVLPLAMALLAAVLAGAPAQSPTVGAPPRDWRLALLPPAALVAAALFAALAVLPYDYLLRTSLETRSPLENLVAQVPAIGYLLGQLLRWDRLNADPALTPVTTLDAATAAGAAALLVALAWALARLRRHPAVAFGVLWTFVWLAPTNSLLARLDLVNDRQWYLAIVGPAWLVGLGVAHAADLAPPHLRVKVAAGVLLSVAAAMAIGTVDRNRVYATEVTFWADVLRKSPHSARAANNLGIAHARACDAAAAAAAFALATRLAPSDPQAEINRVLLLRGELPDVPAECAAPSRGRTS
jgi:hypothetical protein